jgi:glycosyltransferase involved in cell wall biosynthesis
MPLKLSILIPTYNYARYLPQAIESVLRQDFQDFELIVSDDGSSDGSAEILAAYATRDSRVRVHIQRPNLGMVANWNWCLSQARGKYIKYLFGDDCLAHPSALTRLVALLEKNPSASLAGSSRLIMDHASNITELWSHAGSGIVHRGLNIISRCLSQNINLIGEPSAVLFRRAQARRGFDPALRQIVDMEMWFHLLLQGDFAYEPEPLCCFRVHDGQQTAMNRAHHVGDIEMASLIETYLPHLSAHPHQPVGAWTRCAIVHRALLHIRKIDSGQPALRAAIASLSTKLPPAVCMLWWAQHRMRRPFENLRRSTLKRLQRGRQSEAHPSQAAFLAGLPRIA